MEPKEEFNSIPLRWIDMKNDVFYPDYDLASNSAILGRCSTRRHKLMSSGSLYYNARGLSAMHLLILKNPLESNFIVLNTSKHGLVHYCFADKIFRRISKEEIFVVNNYDILGFVIDRKDSKFYHAENGAEFKVDNDDNFSELGDCKFWLQMLSDFKSLLFLRNCDETDDFQATCEEVKNKILHSDNFPRYRSDYLDRVCINPDVLERKSGFIKDEKLMSILLLERKAKEADENAQCSEQPGSTEKDLQCSINSKSISNVENYDEQMTEILSVSLISTNDKDNKEDQGDKDDRSKDDDYYYDDGDEEEEEIDVNSEDMNMEDNIEIEIKENNFYDYDDESENDYDYEYGEEEWSTQNIDNEEIEKEIEEEDYGYEDLEEDEMREEGIEEEEIEEEEIEEEEKEEEEKEEEEEEIEEEEEEEEEEEQEQEEEKGTDGENKREKAKVGSDKPIIEKVGIADAKFANFAKSNEILNLDYNEYHSLINDTHNTVSNDFQNDSFSRAGECESNGKHKLSFNQWEEEEDNFDIAQETLKRSYSDTDDLQELIDDVCTKKKKIENRYELLQKVYTASQFENNSLKLQLSKLKQDNNTTKIVPGSNVKSWKPFFTGFISGSLGVFVALYQIGKSMN